MLSRVRRPCLASWMSATKVLSLLLAALLLSAAVADQALSIVSTDPLLLDPPRHVWRNPDPVPSTGAAPSSSANPVAAYSAATPAGAAAGSGLGPGSHPVTPAAAAVAAARPTAGPAAAGRAAGGGAPLLRQLFSSSAMPAAPGNPSGGPTAQGPAPGPAAGALGPPSKGTRAAAPTGGMFGSVTVGFSARGPTAERPAGGTPALLPPATSSGGALLAQSGAPVSTPQAMEQVAPVSGSYMLAPGAFAGSSNGSFALSPAQ